MNTIRAYLVGLFRRIFPNSIEDILSDFLSAIDKLDRLDDRTWLAAINKEAAAVRLTKEAEQHRCDLARIRAVRTNIANITETRH